MSRIRLVMLSLLAVCAVGAIASVSASAAPPYICLKTAVASAGKFDSSCVTNAGPTANQYIKVKELVKRLGAGEWCGKVFTVNSGEFEANTCTGVAGTKEYIKVLAPEPQWLTENRGLLNTPAETRAVKSVNVGNFELKSSVGNIICSSVKDTGSLIGGNPGTDTSVVTFSGCLLSGSMTCKPIELKPETGYPAGELVVAVKTVLVFRKGSAESFTEALDAFVPEGEGTTTGANTNLFVEFELPTATCGTAHQSGVRVEAVGTEITEPGFKKKCGALAVVGEITGANTFEKTASGVEVTKGALSLPTPAIPEAELWEPAGKAFKVVKCELNKIGAGAANEEVGVAKEETIGPEPFGWVQ